MSDDSKTHEARTRAAVTAAIAIGHKDPKNLRELLIWTTNTTTFPVVDAYFREHQQDRELLAALFGIAAEGEDCGDAPWAAANVIAGFPVCLLSEFKVELVELSNQQWMYLRDPALKALAKISASAT